MSIAVLPPQKTNEISVIADKIETGLQVFEKRKSELTELKKEADGLKITSIVDILTINHVSTIRKKFKSARVEIEKQGKQMRDPLTKLSKFISEKEKELVGIIEPTEKDLAAQEKWIEDEKEKIKQVAIDERMQKLAFTNKLFNRAYIGAMDDKTFTIYLNNETVQYEKEQAEQDEIKRLRQEEAAKLKAEREELEVLRVEREKAQAIIQAENDRIRKEQHEREVAIQAEKQRLEEDKIAAELDRKRIEIEKQRAIELEQARKDAAENARLHEIEVLAAAFEKEEREAALRPDKEKLQAFVRQLGSLEYFETSDPAVQDILDSVHEMISNVQSYIHGKLNEL